MRPEVVQQHSDCGLPNAGDHSRDIPTRGLFESQTLVDVRVNPWDGLRVLLMHTRWRDELVWAVILSLGESPGA